MVSVPLNLAKSRIVKAVCILLCQKHPESQRTSGAGKAMLLVKLLNVGGQRRTYLSRWKLILSDYNALRARLFNSPGLLEEPVPLALYTINQTTLVSDHV